MEPGQRSKAFLPKFENDIFLSYRHLYKGKQDKWLEKLHDCLCDELIARLERVGIWRDQLDLRAGDEWRDEIEKALSSSAIFLAVVTDTYLDSPVCARELDLYFGRRMGDGATRGVIVPVLRHMFDKPPGVFQEYQAVNFCDPKTGLEYPESLAEDRCGGFYAAVVELTIMLRDKLRDLAGVIQKQMPAVFLAEAGFPEHERRQTVRRELLQRDDLILLPAKPYLWNFPNLETYINADLDCAALCVHVVPPGLDAEGERKVRRQLEMAVQMAQDKQGLMPHVWVPPVSSGQQETNSIVNWITDELPNSGVQVSQTDSYKKFKEDLEERLEDVFGSNSVASPGGDSTP
jgi:hypothetical protein